MAESAGRGAALDWKTSLQELTAALGLGVPEYRIEGTGPDHLKTFTAWVVVAGNRYGGAEGRSKKEAEQRAAEAAWRMLADQHEQADQGGAPDTSADREAPVGPLERADRAAGAEQADHAAQAMPADVAAEQAPGTDANGTYGGVNGTHPDGGQATGRRDDAGRHP